MNTKNLPSHSNFCAKNEMLEEKPLHGEKQTKNDIIQALF
jgi:hypothetical protein